MNKDCRYLIIRSSNLEVFCNFTKIYTMQLVTLIKGTYSYVVEMNRAMLYHYHTYYSVGNEWSNKKREKKIIIL